MTGNSYQTPIVYGSPAQIAMLLDSVAQVITSEPRETFEDASVRYFGRQLSGLIGRRVAEASDSNNGAETRCDDDVEIRRPATSSGGDSTGG